jgi:type IV fimbrial biogenesis protein FimT
MVAMTLLRSPATRPRAARGYTIAEILIVVMLLGVLLAAGVPQLGDFVRQQRVKTASFELFSTLVHARSEAIARNGQVSVTPTDGAWVNGWTVTGPGGMVIRKQEPVPAMSITGPDAVVFVESGRLNATARPQFALTTSGANVVHRCIRVDLSGRPVSKAASC